MLGYILEERALWFVLWNRKGWSDCYGKSIALDTPFRKKEGKQFCCLSFYSSFGDLYAYHTTSAVTMIVKAMRSFWWARLQQGSVMCQMLKIVKTIPTIMLVHLLTEPLRVTDRNAMISGISQKSVTINNACSGSIPAQISPEIICSIMPGSINIKIEWADIATAMNIHSTAILVFKSSIIYSHPCSNVSNVCDFTVYKTFTRSSF